MWWHYIESNITAHSPGHLQQTHPKLQLWPSFQLYQKTRQDSAGQPFSGITCDDVYKMKFQHSCLRVHICEIVRKPLLEECFLAKCMLKTYNKLFQKHTGFELYNRWCGHADRTCFRTSSFFHPHSLFFIFCFFHSWTVCWLTENLFRSGAKRFGRGWGAKGCPQVRWAAPKWHTVMLQWCAQNH